MRRALLVLVSVVCINVLLQAQSFVNVAPSLGLDILSNTYQWGTGLSFFDVDEDGLDDLTFAMSGSPTRFYRNLGGNNFQLTTTFFNSDEAKSCLWFDMDEDGDNDLLVTRMLAPLQLFRNEGGWNFTEVSDQIQYTFAPNAYTFGASIGDPNRDGFADIIVSNYGTAGYPNCYLVNQGNGTFIENTSTPLSVYSRMTFQTTWIDLNEDGWQDVYSVNDHNNGNEFYLQNDDGSGFVEQSASTGLGIQTDAMNTSWADYDRDGDLDLYITNIHFGNHLMRNDGNMNFTNVASDAGVTVGEWCWGALWFDSENSGYNDLFICVKDLDGGIWESKVYNNKENGTFLAADIPSLGTARNAFSAVKGDVNNDGKVDLVVSPEMNRKMSVLLNTSTAEGNYIKFRFQGTFSNRNAVGVRYEAFHGEASQIGQLFLGDSYLSQNSQNVHLGLHYSTQVDSLKVYWLSGLTETYYNLDANQLHVITEGSTLHPELQFSKVKLCGPGDSLIASFDPMFSRVVWEINSTSFASDSVAIAAVGGYSLSYGMPYGHLLAMNFEVQEFSQPTTTVSVTPVSCFGQTDGTYQVTYADELGSSYSFENANLPAGVYPVVLPHDQNCFHTELIEIISPDSLQIQVATNAVTCAGLANGVAEISCTGGTAPFQIDAGGVNLQSLPGGQYNGIMTDVNGCSKTFDFVISEPLPLAFDFTVPNALCENEEVVFEASAMGGVGGYSWFGLIPGNTYGPGVYDVTLVDSANCARDTAVIIESIALPDVQLAFVMSNLGYGCIHAMMNGATGSSFAWNTGALDSVLCTDQSGYYELQVTNPFGCSNQVGMDVIISNVETEGGQEPMWVTTPYGFQFKGNSALQQVRVYADTGQLVCDRSIIQSGDVIDFDARGIYFIRAGSQTWKLAK